ncbi:hypothetical protein E1A91_D01G135700v1, partial [Gossypium mustelinum]
AKSSTRKKSRLNLRPWHRSFQFWVRASDIYTGYKVFQLRVSFVKDPQKQHIAQIIGKPNLAPAAWVKRLVTLCDQAPTTPLDDVQLVLEKEFGRSIDEIFENFDVNPLSLASIAHVHRARLRGDKNDVVVKVQHPGIQDLMMTGIHNLQAFALYIQKNDIKFDLFSVAKVMGKHIGYEFDFLRETNAMERICCFFYENNKKTPVLVSKVLRGLVIRQVHFVVILHIACTGLS